MNKDIRGQLDTHKEIFGEDLVSWEDNKTRKDPNTIYLFL
jgi:hypothetical protein